MAVAAAFLKKDRYNGVPLTPFDRGDAANQLVGVMTDIVFKAQKCPAIKPNFALFGTMMLTLGVRQADIDAGKYNEEIIRLLQVASHSRAARCAAPAGDHDDVREEERRW
jgi:hypothetical protein